MDRGVRATLPALGCALATVCAPWATVPASAQVVDRGAFVLSVNGERVGTEEFVIQRSGSGRAQTTLARGTVTLRDGGSVSTQLQVSGPSLSVFRYSVRVTGGDEKTVTLARTGDRLQARTVAPWGEELREYRATDRTVVLDRGVAHLHFLLRPLLQEAPESLHTVTPLSEAEASFSSFSITDDILSIGGETIETRRISFETGGGPRQVWFDASGRLMRVSDGATGFLAERTPTS